MTVKNFPVDEEDIEYLRLSVPNKKITGAFPIQEDSEGVKYIETVDMGPYEALLSTGASRPKCMLRAIWPQVKGYYISTVLYCFESNVKSAAILGYVGAGGIGQIISGRLNLRRYADLGLVLIFMTATIVILEGIARFARRKLVH